MNSPIMELVICRAKPGVTDAQMRAAAEDAKDELMSLPGIINRELLHDADGRWVDVVHWRTMQDAQNALQLVNDKPKLQQMFNLIEPESIQMYHLQQVLAHG